MSSTSPHQCASAPLLSRVRFHRDLHRLRRARVFGVGQVDGRIGDAHEPADHERQIPQRVGGREDVGLALGERQEVAQRDLGGAAQASGGTHANPSGTVMRSVAVA